MRLLIQRCLLTLALLLGWTNTSLAGDFNPCPDSLAVANAPEAPADQRWTFSIGPYVHHWRHDPTHTDAYVFALERRVPGDRFCGLALFRNSFGQPSAYIYAGWRWDNVLDNPDLAFKVTAGMIYGYVGEHTDKVPFNYNGYSLGIIPSLGYKINATDTLDLMVLGFAGLVFGYSHNF